MPRRLLLTFFLLCSLPSALSSALRPNIVFIITDDQGYSDLGHAGADFETPLP